MSKPKTPNTRQTDWLKMDSLHYVADQHGMAVMAFRQLPEGWVVDYFKANARTQPHPELCRDALDYDLKLKMWMHDCTSMSKVYPTFQDMVLGEIERLKKVA